MRRLPIGVQDFEDMITSGYVYVDKTDLIYKLATESKQYFLGRPRRFGKSLLISTLKAYFQGKRELFRGLAIEGLEKEWKSYPVIHLDMTKAGVNFDNYEYRLINRIKFHERIWNLPGDEKSDATTRLDNLIVNAYEKSGKRVVVLIDEYDKQLVEHIGDRELNALFRAKLKDFYGVLKSADEYLRFSFLTGVTKFSQVSIFSDLNHLDDISMDSEYANICGMTAEELADNFEPELRTLAKANGMNEDEVIAEMKKRYDGYNFCYRDGGGVYNPFSILRTLKSKVFRNHWFRTGTPTFLVKSLAESNLNLVKFNDGITVNDDELTDYRAGSGDIVPLLYQSGYLTIKSYADGDYTLGFPNAEVRYGFTQELFNYYVPASLRRDFDAREFVRDLQSRDVDGFMRRFQTFFSSIPYDLISQFKAEAHYQSIVFVMVTLMGQYAAVEVHSSRGRSDLEITLPETQYIIEFKLSKKQDSAKEALAQIKNKGYAEQYMVGGRQIVLVGAVFDPEKRNIVEWTYEISDQ